MTDGAPRIELDPDTRVLDRGRLLLGGADGRLVRLTDDGAARLAALRHRGPTDAAGRALSDRLVAAGLAHPRPGPDQALADDVGVVVPVHERVAGLRRCLAALRASGARHPVVVVDDGSGPTAAAAIAAVCDDHDARRVRLPANQGPAAARTAGTAALDTPFVAYVDSDVEVAAGWLPRLAGHLRDPACAAVAPRVAPRFGAATPTTLAAVGRHRAPLDLGDRPAVVRPYGRVGHVPTAALVVRRTALTAVGGLDERLRTGEDVDLVWRLAAAGWTVRYDPSVVVHHREPTSWRRTLARRRSYGGSAAALATRHPTSVAHVRATPVPAATGLALLTGHPVAALVVAAGGGGRLARLLGRLGVPRREACRSAVRSVVDGVTGLLTGARLVGWPLLLPLLSPRGRRAATLVAAVVGPPLLDHRDRRPDVDPARWTVAATADDLAYGLGVVEGCIVEGTLAPLLPRLVRPPAADARRRRQRARRPGDGDG